MNIDNLIIKINLRIEEIEKQQRELNPNKDASYWLLLGKIDALGDSIVNIIEEYAKENKLNEFQENNLKIYKL